jgi:hypothetical protein
MIHVSDLMNLVTFVVWIFFFSARPVGEICVPIVCIHWDAEPRTTRQSCQLNSEPGAQN